MEIPKELSEIAETWKIIPGLESYAINEDGVIKALPKVREGRLDCLNSHEGCTKKSQRKYKEHLIKPRVSSNYLYVCLMHNGIKRDYRVHRLVYKVFVGDIPEGMVIDHIDGNKLNNNINNLRCVSPTDNMRNPNTRNKCAKPVVHLKADGTTIAEYPSIHLAAEATGVDSAYICRRLLGKIKSKEGTIWKYKEN